MEKLILNTVLQKLKEYDFVISYYKAYSTNSIYIKLDYGVANSIRISDHNGYEKYNYRYNILTNIKESYLLKKEFDKYFFCAADVDKMIEMIVKDKKNKIVKYGETNYKQYMETEKERNVNKKFKYIEK